MTEQDSTQRIAQIEHAMNLPEFWQDPKAAQEMIKELQSLRDAEEGKEQYDRCNAVLSIVAGAGGADAEDFARMLVEMYMRYADNHAYTVTRIHENENDHGGYRNITLLVEGKNVYGNLKHEAGVHRLVRISPFNANDKRQTSFVLVEVSPEFKDAAQGALPEDELEISFAKSGGAGGQNVNKRETAVRIVHIPTNISVHVSSERSQHQNKERGLALLAGKVYAFQEEQRKREMQGLTVDRTMKIEWGNQIRSYVQHPYKMVKDHRTGYEVNNVDAVLGGDIDDFIEAMKTNPTATQQ
ncbi:hypothetical protein A3C89_01835 [Candidatus Kaiserbacteria bacterium RIFCSPHIGHO2_02_FULL_50_50]|uniref:Peptide chain release factor domain-containing protein n=1 Tax=Candidatus Kaiserbacteria bacterium RIFCSPHIGHO2_02_FULL_50_50 TaxID=1798492 RepID=A0A1F6DCT3_9BACT|nr:MAG: hypothetical protein A3C89_01835 [Candidatus Kaiserbacteria bacterium RIFCSPHIGHO2_02_FULL_50_50]OGG89012.1 MAG: hypothetical protein A3G62_04240 [Candidatus Kaiserbacteria bacterium RIFCSPLOWO2_12_FULL_50_10]